MSYVSGANAVPLRGETIGQQLDRTATRFPDGLALVVRQQKLRLTWRELREEVDRLAAGLLAIGIETGDRVGIWSPNNVEWVLTQLATARAGLVLVCINPAYRVHELDYALNKADCRALVTATAFKTSDYAAMLMELLPELAHCAPGELRATRVPSLRSVVQIGVRSLRGSFGFDEVMARGGAAERARLIRLADLVQFDDPVNIQFTSGTTGSPKGATLTHHNLVNNGFFCGETMRYTQDDRVCIPVPLYHCFGNSIGAMACLTHGTAMVFPGEGFDPLAVLEAVQEERCTSLYGVPTMFIAEMAQPDFDKYDLRSLRTGMMAGSPCPIEVTRRVISLMNLTEITIGYGMTETSPLSFQTVIEAPIERRVSTVGTVHPHMEAKVIDAEGRVVPVGTPGELCTRGYAVMLGYWNDPERTAQAIDPARWMHTGDLATIDAEGYCAIVGRLKDMVIRGGENVYPREVEEFLYKHPKVMDVQVFGVPDPKYGEEICAWIKLCDDATMTEEELRTFCRDRIAHYKVPRYIRFVREFPITVTGKMQKFLMREAMERELAGEASGDRSAELAT
jgi:fatty-acyl-CoA synthase